MKNKVLLSVGLLMGIFGAGLHAAAEQSNEPGFDFMNKTGKPVWIAVTNANKLALPWTEVKPAKIMPLLDYTMVANNVSAKINIYGDTDLRVIVGGTLDEVSKHKALDYFYGFKPGKKIYVTLHNDGKLIPQVGPSKGKKGVIEAGYSKEGMITPDDIIPLNPKTMRPM